MNRLDHDTLVDYCSSVDSWGEKMVMTLALRLIFPHTTLELVLSCDRKFEFTVAHYFLSNQQHGEHTNINNIKTKSYHFLCERNSFQRFFFEAHKKYVS
jgi:hypothetical protein